jgi:hypothetical protein
MRLIAAVLGFLLLTGCSSTLTEQQYREISTRTAGASICKREGFISANQFNHYVTFQMKTYPSQFNYDPDKLNQMYSAMKAEADVTVVKDSERTRLELVCADIATVADRVSSRATAVAPAPTTTNCVTNNGYTSCTSYWRSIEDPRKQRAQAEGSAVKARNAGARFPAVRAVRRRTATGTAPLVATRVPGVVGLACAFYDTPPLKALDLDSVPPSLDTAAASCLGLDVMDVFQSALSSTWNETAGSPQRLATAQQAAQADVIRQRSAGLFPRSASLFFLILFLGRWNPRARAAKSI